MLTMWSCNCGMGELTLNPGESGPDGGGLDAGNADSGVSVTDAGRVDAGSGRDAGSSTVEEPDSGSRPVDPVDSGHVIDAGFDAGAPDASVFDAGGPIVTMPDASVPDAGGCGPNGTSCGTWTCAGNPVCMEGQCVTLPVKEGEECGGPPGQCQAQARCQQGLCYQPPAANCGGGDLQITVTWDNLGQDLELHLIRPGGHINDEATKTDCTWTTCLGTNHPDWGTLGVSSDDPRKDVDNQGPYGPENIYLNAPETGRYAILVEHWGNGQPCTADVFVRYQGAVVYHGTITNFAAHTVWDVGRMDFPNGTFSLAPSPTIDCRSNWRLTTQGCDLTLP